MKTTSLSRWLLGCVIVGSLAVPVLPLAAASKTNTPAAAPASPELEPVAIPQSDFTVPKSPREGRDPFFPDSLRLFGATGTRTNVTPSVASYQLKGLAGQAGARIATIGTTGPAGVLLSVDLAVGEEREVVTSTGRVKVRCVEIRDDSVIIEASGARRELHLRAGR